MSWIVLGIVIIAACIHAAWNFAAKRARGDLGVLAAGMLSGAVLYLPVASYVMYTDNSSTRHGLVLALMSGMVNILYFFFLSLSYRYGDISTNYPVARGTGVVLTSVFAFIILGESLPVGAYAGILVIAVGAIAIGMERFRTVKGLPFALAVGISISGYSLIDKAASPFIHPFLHVYIINLLPAVALATLVTLRDRNGIKRAFSQRRTETLSIGIGAVGSYLLILMAYRLAEVSTIVAAREFSVVIGAVLGFLLLKEKVSTKKVLGILAVAIGLVLLKISQ